MPRLMFLLAMLSLAACGGGGGGGGAVALDAGVFSGQYTLLFVRSDAGLDTGTFWGTATADGVSEVALAGTENSNGSVSTPSPSTVGYVVGPDGTLTLQTPTTDVYRGTIRSDGIIAVLVSLLPSNQGILVLLKSEGAYSAASLAGAYGLGAFVYNPDTMLPATTFANATLDGVDTVTGSGAVNVNGSVSSGGSLLASYAVAPDGTGTFSGGPVSFSGAWSPGGTLGLFAGDTVGGATQAVAVYSLLRRGTGLSNATLSGAYAIVGIEYAPGGPAFNAFEGTLTADGAGGLSVTGTTNTGTALDPLAGTGSYVVGPDGEMLVNRTGLTENIAGNVSPDGAFFTAAGGAENGSSLVLYIAFRK